MSDGVTGNNLKAPANWRPLKAPTLEEFEVMAVEAFRRLPENFRAMCAGLVIKIDDFATDEVLDHLGAKSEFDVLGLFQGVGLPFQSSSAPVQMPNMIWLYRRPILDYWSEHDETLGEIVTHVLVHEIGHHFGMSDDDMEAIEASVE
jgi:predicted Zn-dependent protease with MMP-like domain